MKQILYIANIITMTTAVICGWYWFIIGSILEIGDYMLVGILLNLMGLLCAIQHDRYREDEDIQEFKQKIINKLHTLCEEQS